MRICDDSVRTRTDTTLDQDCVLKALVQLCTACVIVSLFTTCLNLNIWVKKTLKTDKEKKKIDKKKDTGNILKHIFFVCVSAACVGVCVCVAVWVCACGCRCTNYNYKSKGSDGSDKSKNHQNQKNKLLKKIQEQISNFSKIKKILHPKKYNYKFNSN